MANIVNFTDKQFENRLNDNLEELVQGKKAVEYIAFIRENVTEEENIKEQIKKEKAKLMEARLSYKNVAENNWVDTLMKYKNQRKITKEMLNDLIEKIYINNDGRKIKLVFKYEDAFKLAMDYLKIVKEGGNTNA